MDKEIQLISAPSILGLKPNGVEFLAEALLNWGLADNVGTALPVLHVPTLNHLYSEARDTTQCINVEPLRDFSISLAGAISKTIREENFALVLGGDCSILLGCMAGLKSVGNYGLVFLDAHADFYEPEKSTTGETADMDLALVTGRGPELLTDMNNLKPYVKDESVTHIGQRDRKETQRYGSKDIRDTAMRCFDLELIRKEGIEAVMVRALSQIASLTCEGFWIHFDTDVLDDTVNPAVDYRLPGGLSFAEAEYILKSLVQTGSMAGITVTIFNPKLDPYGSIAKSINELLGRVLG